MTKPPTENAYKAIFRTRAVHAIKEAHAAAALTHPGVKGRVRETLIGDLMRPLLPADLGIGTGQIIEAKSGRLSREQDIILYDRSIVPPITFDVAQAIIPIEAVLYTIEVKSLLTKADLVKAHESAKEIRSFSYLTGQFDDSGREIPHLVGRPICAVFALGTDLEANASNDAKRYIEICGADEPQLSAICIAGRGYWYEWKGVWVAPGNTLEGDEILAFISGVMNTYRHIAATRRWPRLGNYLMEPSSLSMNMVPGPDRAAIKVVCEKCGETAMTIMPRTSQQIDYPAGYISPDLCPLCGGQLKAPRGKYESRDGVLTLIQSDSTFAKPD